MITPDIGIPRSSWILPTESRQLKLIQRLLLHARCSGTCFFVRTFRIAFSVRVPTPDVHSALGTRRKTRVLRLDLLSYLFALHYPSHNVCDLVKNTGCAAAKGEVCINCEHMTVARISRKEAFRPTDPDILSAVAERGQLENRRPEHQDTHPEYAMAYAMTCISEPVMKSMLLDTARDMGSASQALESMLRRMQLM
jgi:hypothetical protein